MLKRTFSLLMLTLLLVSMVTVAFRILPVKAAGTIYIRADGSIDPPDAPISTVDNATYTLTGDIASDGDGIIVERDNVIVDGAGYTIQGTGAYWSTGIYLMRRSNVAIRNMTIDAFYHGIWFFYSSSNSVSGNNIANSNFGVYLGYSSGNDASGNNIANNHFGVLLDHSSGNDASGNNITANSNFGVLLDYSSGNNVSSNNITNDGTGVDLDRSSDNNVSGNNITNSYEGIRLEYSSSGNSVVENVLAGGGLWVSESYGNSVEGNSVNGKPLVYLEDASDRTIGDAGQVILVNCNNIRVENLNLSNTDVGVEMWNTNDTKIANNTVTANNEAGVYLYSSSGNSVSGNNISGNYVSLNNFGVWLESSSNNNSISGNNITANSNFGVYLGYSSGNSVSGNNVSGNYLGVGLYSSSGNSIFHNNFNNARWQVWTDGGSVNMWDDGYPSGGNYWSDYSGVDLFSGPHQNETGSDGIGDMPYVIDGSNQDNYPMMKPIVPLPGDVNGDHTVDIFDCVIVALAFGSKPGDSNWNPIADINNDGIVDIFDMVVVALHFGETS